MARRKNKKPKNKIVKGLELAVISLFIALLVRAFVVCGYVIPSDSMENTLFGGDVVLAQKISYSMRRPKPGEIVVFRYPLNPKKYFIKRCIATAGQTVEIVDKTLYVDGHIYEDPPKVTYKDPEVLEMIFSNRDNFGPYTVPEKSIFVMGDNRDQSEDSRSWGEVPLKFIQAKPMFVYFSWAEAPNAPEYNNILNLLDVIWYNIVHLFDRLRLGRIGVFPS
ncbi:MAG: signal peptidase I [Candidatus Zixiibacteriota bacterium]